MSKIPALYVPLASAKSDPALSPGARGARKLLVTEILPRTERPADDPIWRPPPDGSPCPVQQMNDTEVAVFNEHAKQDRHFHRLATEIYMVIEGTMPIEVDDQLYRLGAGDMIVINPGACHEVKPEGTRFLCRVVTTSCGGAADKYLCQPAI